MGRFYKTAKPEFIDDFTYQPPWEMMQQALQKEQGDYDLANLTANIYGSVDYEHMSTPQEREKARLIQEEYANASDELTKKLAEAKGNWRSVSPEINKLKRKLEVDYKTGRIYEQEQSAKAFAEHQKQLSTITDPRMRAAAQQKAMMDFESKGGIYTPTDALNNPDVIGEYYKVKKEYEPDQVAKAYARIKANNGNYTEQYKEDIKFINDHEKNFEAFAMQEKFKPYYDLAHEYKLGNYKDENGNYLKPSDSRSTLYNDYNIAKGLNYSQTTKDADIKYTGALNDSIKLGWEAQDRQAAKTEIATTPVRNIENYFKYTKEGQQVLQKKKEEENNLATLAIQDPKKPGINVHTGKPITQQDIAKSLNSILNSKDKNSYWYKQHEKINNKYNADFEAGTKYLLDMGIDAKTIKDINARYDKEDAAPKFGAQPLFLDWGKNIKGQQLLTKGSEKIKLENLIGKYHSGFGIIKNYKVIEKTVLPTFAAKLTDGLPNVGASAMIELMNEDGNTITIEGTTPENILDVRF